jgi:hypothetical protein
VIDHLHCLVLGLEAAAPVSAAKTTESGVNINTVAVFHLDATSNDD